jgi:hypothetical protein
MRLVLIQGDACAIFEDRVRLAVYEGAKGLDKICVEQVRRAHIEPMKTENQKNDQSPL